jgi:hypothetical protein
LWWPMLIAGICFFVGLFLVKETYHDDIDDASTSTSAVSEAAGKAAKK